MSAVVRRDLRPVVATDRAVIFMRIKTIPIISFIILCLTSCTSTVTESIIREEVKSTKYDTLGIIYYKGRKEGYDYFQAEWNVGSKAYRVKVPNNIVKKPMNYTSVKSKWIVCGPHDLDSWLP